MHADDALAELEQAAAATSSGGTVEVRAEVLAAVLTDWPRLRKVEKDCARRVMPGVVDQLGAPAVIEELRELLPRLVASPTQRQGPPTPEV